MPTKATKKAKSKQGFSLISDEKFLQIYAAMVRLRGRRNARGLEAALVGTTVDLHSTDLVVAPTALSPAALHRNSAQGTVAASSKSSHLLTSAGAALGLRTAGGDGVVVAFCGAEVMHRDAWREALQLAGAHRLPILFVLLPSRRNGTGAHADARSIAAIASEAAEAGVITIPVDMADAVAMYRVAFESLARARRRSSATLIVCTDYALEDGTKKRGTEDPVARMRIYLQNKGLLRAAKKR